MISREMNSIEIEVLNLIINRAKELVHRYGRGFREVLEFRA